MVTCELIFYLFEEKPREKKAEQGNTVDEEYEFTAFTFKNTNVGTKTNLYRILFIYRVVINFITYFFL